MTFWKMMAVNLAFTIVIVLAFGILIMLFPSLAAETPEPRILLSSCREPCEFLPSIEVREELSDTGSSGVVLYVQFSDKQFLGGVPQRFTLLLDWNDTWHEKWELNVARVFIVKDGGEIVDAPTRFAEVRLDREPIEISLAGLQADQTYLVAMQMIPAYDLEGGIDEE